MYKHLIVDHVVMDISEDHVQLQIISKKPTEPLPNVRKTEILALSAENVKKKIGTTLYSAYMCI